MTRAWAVIGAQFGDEGKGAMTDALVHELGASDTLVVRHNGGAQAGHTVCRAGARHVFQHFGSGTMAGAATYLSHHFVANPMLFVHERQQLCDMGYSPRLTASPHATVTTPFDMMLNQAVERHRGSGRHGSCGLGINETMVRQNSGYGLSLADLTDTDTLQKTWLRIRREHLPKRLGQLGLTPADLMPWMDHPELLPRFLEDVASMRQHIDLQDRPLVPAHGLVFEGAQGLRLDQDHPFFPHVTHSRTGLRNVMELTRAWGVEWVQPIYLSRCYVTRHGAGPLPHEWKILPEASLQDQTNQPNAHQGSLRFAPFSWSDLSLEIARDWQHADPSICQRPWLGLSSLDRITTEGAWVQDCTATGSIEACLSEGLRAWGPRHTLARGPAAVDINDVHLVVGGCGR